MKPSFFVVLTFFIGLNLSRIWASQQVFLAAPQPFPEGCGNPYVDIPAFSNFFESALQQIAASKGPEAKGVVDLFAVWELRNIVADRLSDPTVESPVDRLILSQLCQFQRVEMKSSITKSGPNKVDPIDSSHENLHTHLLLVSSKLYAQTRELTVSFLAERAKRLNKEGLAARKAEDIRRARELGRKKVNDLLE
jgi:hypothetical protein